MGWGRALLAGCEEGRQHSFLIALWQPMVLFRSPQEPSRLPCGLHRSAVSNTETVTVYIYAVQHASVSLF